MSEEILRTVKTLLQSSKGDPKRLKEILETLKQGTPIVMSDYRYIQNLSSGDAENLEEKRSTIVTSSKDKSLELLRVRLAEGEITIEEFRVLKKALTED